MKKSYPKLVTIIDDDQDDRELFLMAINEVASEIICQASDDPERFLQMVPVQVELPDVIFLDINMPRIDGYQFLSVVKHDARFDKTKIVMYSTTNELTERRKAKSLGADAFITKPHTYPELCKVLRNFIQTTF